VPVLGALVKWRGGAFAARARVQRSFPPSDGVKRRSTSPTTALRRSEANRGGFIADRLGEVRSVIALGTDVRRYRHWWLLASSSERYAQWRQESADSTTFA
jgi:hypothetical protein